MTMPPNLHDLDLWSALAERPQRKSEFDRN
jgi:hypothetical protein